MKYFRYGVRDPRTGEVYLWTLARNRHDAWNSFCRPEQRQARKKNGYKVVFCAVEITVQEKTR